MKRKEKLKRWLLALAIAVQFQPWAKMEQRDGAMIAEASEVISNIRVSSKIDETDLPKTVTGMSLSVTVDSYIDSQWKTDRGFVCASNRDIKCVQGLCAEGEYYWAILINGDSQHTSLNSTLSPGDELELVYKKKNPQDHQRLQEWLLSSVKGR